VLEESLRTRDYATAVTGIRRSDSKLNPTAYRNIATALALLQVGRPVEAERRAAGVTRREPYNAQTWVALARIQVARGRLPAARTSWARARRLDPHLRAALPAPIAILPKR
jgi:predicted Zn-dependent protease